MEKSKTYWGCPRCRQEFGDTTVPPHTVSGIDMGTLKIVERPCGNRRLLQHTVEFDRATLKRVK